MKTSTNDKTDQDLDIFTNIEPSENWDFNFQKKSDDLNIFTINSVSKFNVLLLLLVFVNVGCILNLLSNEKTDKQNLRNDHFKIIYDDLLISNN